jgi:hypothetical protein
MSERYEDLGGQRGTPYDGAILRACISCGAEAGSKCTFKDGFGVTHTRHLPCLSRINSPEAK